MFSIFSIPIHTLPKKQILQKVEAFLEDETYHQIATVNPEFLLEAQRNKAFQTVLQNCELTVPDGFGIRIASWLLRLRSPFQVTSYKSLVTQIYPGIDLMWDILRIANEKQLKVFLVANKDGLSTWEQTASAIQKVYPNLEIHGVNMEYPTANYQLPITNFQSHSVADDFPLNSKIKIQNSTIVFCNFGAPEQELFLAGLKDATIGSIRLGMGVGGAFDYITGAVPRAPRWMQKVGLEWLFRLWVQPRRWRRILHAVIVFPLKVLFSKREG